MVTRCPVASRILAWQEVVGLQVFCRNPLEFGYPEFRQLLLGHRVCQHQSFERSAASFELPPSPDLILTVRLQRDSLKIAGHAANSSRSGERLTVAGGPVAGSPVAR